MKMCNKCKAQKSLDLFYRRVDSNDGLSPICKVCTAIGRKMYYKTNRQKAINYARSWYSKNRAHAIKLEVERKRRIIKERKQILLGYLRSHPCVDCGEGDIRVLDFDHVRGIKRGNISTIYHKIGIKALIAEIEKCDIRCSNCHRKRHYRGVHYKLSA